MDYPATIDVRTPERVDNWRPLVQWILAIPHLIIAGALGYAGGAVAIVSWFVILFTGELPAGLANFQVMVMRYSSRTQAYAGFLHPEYPPFEFTTTAAEPGGTPVLVDIRPELSGRDRLTVGLRLIWLVPIALFTMVIGLVGAVCWFLGLFAILFTGRWPDGLRSWVMKSIRVSLRTNAYANLLTDRYPPFSTD